MLMQTSHEHDDQYARLFALGTPTVDCLKSMLPRIASHHQGKFLHLGSAGRLPAASHWIKFTKHNNDTHIMLTLEFYVASVSHIPALPE